MLVNVDGTQSATFFFNYNSVFDGCFTRPSVFVLFFVLFGF